jgi:PadR family transcriptional regulator, regulatory protein AphA
MPPKPAGLQSLDYILLGMLAQQPRHGYELHKELSNLEGLGLVWHTKQAQLYALLDKLEKQGYLISRSITTESHPPRKEYHLTASGLEVFKTWMLSPVEHGREIRQDFLAKFFFARVNGEETARQVIDAQREVLERLQARIEFKDDTLLPTQTYEKQVYLFRLKQIQAFITWLDACMSEI